MKLVRHLLELATALVLLPAAWLMRLLRGSPERISIVGWWGSETVGDVAILGQLLAECRESAPGAEITLVSFDAQVTRRTLEELGALAAVRLVAVGPSSAPAIALSRTVVYGGGPLMESRSMPLWALRSAVARMAGARVVIYACGIGPLRSRATRFAVEAILRLADEVALRDLESLAWNEPLLRSRKAVVVFDPALDYVRSRIASVSRPLVEDRLALALRFPPPAYLDGARDGDESHRLLDVIAGALDRLASERPLSLVGCVMHTGHAQSDDHLVYERLADRLGRGQRLEVRSGRHSVDDVIGVLTSSRALLTLRFHGMIFAMATGTPFVAIDSVRPSGKISAAAALAGCRNAVIPWDELEVGVLSAHLRAALVEQRTARADDLATARRERVAMLGRATRA